MCNETNIFYQIDNFLKGNPGYDGLSGPKGNKGKNHLFLSRIEINLIFLNFKGEIGPQGLIGLPGIEGLKGDIGQPGLPGDIGPKGDKGFKGSYRIR